MFGPGVRVALGASVLRRSWLAPANGSGAPSERFPDRGHPGRAYSEHPDCRRHRERVRHGLCRARALRLHRSGSRRSLLLGAIGIAHHAGRRLARAGAGGPRACRLPGRAAAGVLADAQSLAAGDLSRRSSPAPPMRWRACAAGCGWPLLSVAGAFVWGLALLGQVGRQRRHVGVGRCSCTSACSWRWRPPSWRIEPHLATSR